MEDHADALAQLHDIRAGRVQLAAVEPDAAARFRARDGVVHPIEAAQECGFSAARWPDEGGDLPLADLHAHVLKSDARAIAETQVFDDDRGHGSAEPSRDVVLGALVAWGGENARPIAALDELAGKEERGEIGDARRLLDAVWHDDHGVLRLQLEKGLLDLGRGDGIQTPR